MEGDNQIPPLNSPLDSVSNNHSYSDAIQAGEIQEIRKREESYQMMIAEIQDYAIILMDRDGVIQNWNIGAEKIKGYRADEIVGKNFRIFYPKEDQEKQLPERLIREAITNNRAVYEGWRVRKDKSIFWGNTVITALHDENKNIVGFSKVTRDLTERKLAEDRLIAYAKQLETKTYELESALNDLKQARMQLADDRTRFIIESIPHIVFTVTSHGLLNYSNHYLYYFTGIGVENFKGKAWHNCIIEEDRVGFIDSWERSLFTGLNMQIECRLRRADGENIWHLAIAKPLYDLEAEMAIWIVTFTNIHDQKMLNEKKDEFIGIASHELKTPLTSAKAYVQLLQASLENADHSKEAIFYAQKANSSLDRLNGLISELLDISKIQHGKLQLNLSEFNFNELVKESIDLMQASFSKHAIHLSGFYKVTIKADRERLHQVLVNLLSNAIKYSPESIRIDVKVTIKKDEILVAVIDYGVGIPKSDLERIFDKFYRVEDKATQFQGLGIGLFICAEIIQRHHGKIWAESSPGNGSSFYFTLPLGNTNP